MMWQAIRFALLTFVLCGLLYPLAMTGLAQVIFPTQANGSLIRDRHGAVMGSVLIGQNFTQPGYFHPRPSSPGYDAANSGGYNQGASNGKLVERVQKAAADYRLENALKGAVPVDAATASASGLDPHISLANALAQVERISAARRMDPAQVRQLIRSHQEDSRWLTDNPHVNVLRLNLALDRLSAGTIKESAAAADDTRSGLE